MKNIIIMSKNNENVMSNEINNEMTIMNNEK